MTTKTAEGARELRVNTLEEREECQMLCVCVLGGGRTGPEVDKSPLCPWKSDNMSKLRSLPDGCVPDMRGRGRGRQRSQTPPGRQ